MKGLEEFFLALQSPLWLSFLADVLSFVGFLLTIRLLILTKKIRKEFQSKARIPELRKTLVATVKSLTTLLQDWQRNRNQIVVALTTCQPVLESLKVKLSRSQSSSSRNLLKALRAKRRNWLGFQTHHEHSEEDVWRIFAELQGVIASLEQLEKDAKWE